jgi:cytoskeletal protein CcmA (bactofilin family)
MFRRKEDGSEEFINDDTITTSAAAGTSAPNPVAPSAAAPAPMPTAPAAQPAPSFRPAPPQAAMAASRPAPATMSQPATPSERPQVAASRLAAKRVLTVGPDIQMKGEITTCDRVVIEGMVDATMRDVHTVELAETGSLKGTAEVEDAEISGSFEGDLVVRGKLTVYSAGRVRGNITYGEIEIQRGGQISGNIRNVAEAKNGQAVPAPSGKKAA